MKTGCGVGCATATTDGESAVAKSIAAEPSLTSRPGLAANLAAKLPVGTVMGASIAVPRSDYGIGKSRRVLLPTAASCCLTPGAE